MWKAFLGVCARQGTTRGRCPGATGARARSTALQLGLDGSAGYRIVVLLQGCKARWSPCSALCVCGSNGGRVVRRSLLSNCPSVPTPAKRLALHDVLLGFLPVSKDTALLDSVPVGVLRALSGPCRTFHSRPASSAVTMFC